MTRTSIALDRLATFLLGLVLIAVGAGAAVWAAASVWNIETLRGLPELVTAPQMVNASQAPWWPWAATAIGAVLVLSGLRWLTLHTAAPKAKTLQLEGSGPEGRLCADLGQVAAGAARVLAQRADIHSAQGTAIIDRGVRTFDFEVTTDSPDDLAAVAAAVDAVCRDAVSMVGDPSLATCTRIRIAKTAHNGRRVS